MSKKRGRATNDDYQLLSIDDALSCVGQRVNLMGVIIEHSLPKKSAGTDHWCLLVIVDESYHSRGFVVNLFGNSMDKLPQVESSGDIIRLSKVMIRAHKNEINAASFKGSSAFALYEGKHGQSFTPYQVSSNFCTREQDNQFVADLRMWMNNVDLGTVSNKSISLGDIHKGEQLDLVCKILHKREDNQAEPMMFVWDGTDAPPCNIQERLDNELDSPLPLQIEGESLPRDIVSKFPTVGTVLRVKLELELHSSTLVVGRWVKLIGLTFEVRAGLWYGIFASCTRIKYLPEGDCRILKLQSDFDNRISSKWGRVPFSCVPWPTVPRQVTEIRIPDYPLVTLVDIINFSQVTAIFKCVIRVVAILPSDPKDFRSPSGIYRIRLTIEDPTARLHAYLYDEDAEVFFNGYPDINGLTQKRNKFLGITETDDCNKGETTPRNPPWMRCCIKSYYLDEANMWETRRYRVFATVVVT